MRSRIALCVAVIAAVGLATGWPLRAAGAGVAPDPASAAAGDANPVVGDAAVGGGGAPATVTASPNVTTGGAVPINGTTILLYGSFEGVNGPVDVYFQYRERSSTAGEWRSTDLLPVVGGDRFFRNVTDLEPATTYGYRAVLSTENGTWTGTVRTANTTGGEATPTPSPVTDVTPCPSFRGASGLCTGTPTPSAVDDATDADDPDDAPPSESGWLDGLAPALAWFALVAILAPLVLGGLVGLDSLRGGGE
jgi:hypothetical protein